MTKEQRAQAVASLQEYARRNLEEPLGELQAGLLLDFLLEEIGPLIFNEAVRAAQARLQRSVGDLDGELFREEFPYWQHPKRRSRTT